MAAFGALRRAWVAAGGLRAQVHRAAVPLRWSQAKISFVLQPKSFPLAPWRLNIRCQSTAAVAGIQVAQGVSATPLEKVLPLEELGQVLQEPTLAELGLESYTPVGFILKDGIYTLSGFPTHCKEPARRSRAPIFISFFFALRKMAECPVPSMQTGGLWWFMDLTTPDPYYILPVMASVTMWIVTEIGMQAGPPNPNLDLMKKVFRVMPVVFLPFIISFPTAIFTYWLTSNLFSIMQILLFRLPAARAFFHIPERVEHNPKSLPPQEDFLKSVKEGWQNVKMAHQLDERQKVIPSNFFPESHTASKQAIATKERIRVLSKSVCNVLQKKTEKTKSLVARNQEGRGGLGRASGPFRSRDQAAGQARRPWLLSGRCGERGSRRGGFVHRPTIRHQSTAAVAGTQEISQIAEDSTLAELGLGSFSPVGLIMKILESLHLDLGLPWWGAIVGGTLLARCLVFPIIVKCQQQAVKLNNHYPQMSEMNSRISDARKSGNQKEFIKAYTELNQYQKAHNLNPKIGFLAPLVQMPIFISFFFALRKMAECPVPSMQTGGLFYHMMKTVFRVMPFLLLPVTINFPTVLLLRLPSVRTFFHISKQEVHKPVEGQTQKGVIDNFKD
ncbi:hypothetical protein E2320_003587, partial [Naja naja]